jgi:hypothetical protein
MRWVRNLNMQYSQGRAYRILLGKFDRNRAFGRLGLGGRIILKWVLRK